MTLRSTLLFASALALGGAAYWYFQGPDEVRGASTTQVPEVDTTQVEPEDASRSLVSAAAVEPEPAAVVDEPAPEPAQVAEAAPKEELTPAQQVLANYVREQGRDPHKFMSSRPDNSAKAVRREAGVKAARLVEKGQLDADSLSSEDRAAYEEYQARREAERAARRAAKRDR